jgi:hypothetical protein
MAKGLTRMATAITVTIGTTSMNAVVVLQNLTMTREPLKVTVQTEAPKGRI